MNKYLFMILFGLFILMLASCGQSAGQDENPRIGIRGEIKQIEVDKIYVEGTKEVDTDYDKAYVGIAEHTKIIEKGTNKELNQENLQIGMKVEVIFEGAVAESYPVQGTAKEIRILSE